MCAIHGLVWCLCMCVCKIEDAIARRKRIKSLHDEKLFGNFRIYFEIKVAGSTVEKKKKSETKRTKYFGRKTESIRLVNDLMEHGM